MKILVIKYLSLYTVMIGIIATCDGNSEMVDVDDFEKLERLIEEKFINHRNYGYRVATVEVDDCYIITTLAPAEDICSRYAPEHRDLVRPYTTKYENLELLDDVTIENAPIHLFQLQWDDPKYTLEYANNKKT